MDMQKMGAFIRELRKEQNMTQKDLAEQLHITDRAVSKWERGLNGPDLSTLEPLAEVLQVTVTELIAGERAERRGEDLGALIGYSAEKTALDRRLRRRCAAFALLLAALAAAMVCSILWFKGVFSIVECTTSPNGEVTLTVYSRDMADDPFSRSPRVTVIEDHPGDLRSTMVYGGTFQGLWWAPDSSKYVLTLEMGEGTRTVLVRPGTVTELEAWLPLVTGEEAQYQFCQWAADSDHMLIRYTRADGAEGYFWCRCSTGTVSGWMELER